MQGVEQKRDALRDAADAAPALQAALQPGLGFRVSHTNNRLFSPSLTKNGVPPSAAPVRKTAHVSAAPKGTNPKGPSTQ